MCTSLTLTANDQTVLLARTMDFPNVDPWVPRSFAAQTTWQPVYGDAQVTQTRIVGASRHLNGHDLLGDGLNADGLACAELYLPHAVHYYHTPQTGRINLTPQDFIMWVLSGHKTVAEVVAELPNVALVASVWFAENKVYPFHWLIADQTGASVVIEPTTLTLRASPNSVGVLTNTPVLANHEKRLLAFLNAPELANLGPAATEWVQQGRELPTGPVPTNRFIRTAINRWGHPTPITAEAAISAAFDYLNQVVIPKQSGRQPRNHNFTHYRCVIDLTHLTYFHIPTATNKLSKTVIS